MNRDEKDAFFTALRRMSEETINPYPAVAASLERSVMREKAEAEWWSQFLPGHSGPAATIKIEPSDSLRLPIHYAPNVDGGLAAGEIVRTWTPLDEGHGGAYGPVLILGETDSGRFVAVRLSTTSHHDPQRYFPIGAGPKDAHGRWSWVDLAHLLSVHPVRRSVLGGRAAGRRSISETT